MNTERLQVECAKRRIKRAVDSRQRRESIKRAARSIVTAGAEHLSGKDRKLMKALGKEIPVHEVAEKFETDKLTAALIICGVLG